MRYTIKQTEYNTSSGIIDEEPETVMGYYNPYAIIVTLYDNVRAKVQNLMQEGWVTLDELRNDWTRFEVFCDGEKILELTIRDADTYNR